MNFLAEEQETKQKHTILQSHVAKMFDSGVLYQGLVVRIEHNPVKKMIFLQICYDEGNRDNSDDIKLKDKYMYGIQINSIVIQMEPYFFLAIYVF